MLPPSRLRQLASDMRETEATADRPEPAREGAPFWPRPCMGAEGVPVVAIRLGVPSVANPLDNRDDIS